MLLGDVETLSLLTIATMIFLFILLGAIVQKITLFIWPHDIFTIIFLIIIGTNLLAHAFEMGFIPLNLQISVVATISYFFGYVISSRKKYKNILRVNSAIKHIHMTYMVTYISKDMSKKIAEQTNKGLIKRLLFNVEHSLIGTASLEEDWKFTIDHAYYPIPPMDFFNADIYFEHPPRSVKKWPFSAMKVYETEIIRAPSSMKTALELMFEERSRERDVRTNMQLVTENMQLKTDGQSNALYTSAEIINYVVTETSPAAAMQQFIKERKKEEQDKEQKQESMTKQYLIRRWKNKKGENNG